MQSFTVNAPRTITDVLRYEVHPNYTREQESFAGHGGSEENEAHDIGTVLGKITEGGAVVPLNTAANDGSQTAYGVLLQKVVTAADAVPCLVLERGPAEVVLSGLIWPDAISDNNKATALTSLLAKGIKARAD
jgi:hypothetical protein